MKILEKLKEIKEKAKKLTTKKSVKAPVFSHFKIELTAEKTFPKTSKKIDALLTFTGKGKEKIKIKHISCEILEDVDPLIGKAKKDAESIGKKETKKGFTLQADQEKEVKMSVPISFEVEKNRKKTGGDMQLLNHMSERSKKTAINYTLHTIIQYIPEGTKETKKKTLKHSVRFE